MLTKCHRWNFEAQEDGVYACKGSHEKGEKCDYGKLSPFELVDIINEMRSRIIEYEAKLKLITNQSIRR